MRQVHNVNESYESYSYRKRNVNSNALIVSGLFAFLFGYMALEVGLTETSIPIFIIGAITFLLGFKIRK